MISIVLYGRNDSYGYNLHKRAALSLNCMAEVLTAENDEILFVDYNTPDDFPTFPEAIADTLTEKAKRLLRIIRIRPAIHDRLFASKTHLKALEPISRNAAIRRSNPANRWILSTNTDMIFVPRNGLALSDQIAGLADGFYCAPRFEIPETLWESFNRLDPVGVIAETRAMGNDFHLNEIVYGSDSILYDAPGDFQLMRREDLFDIQGFHEGMLLGWHLDSNISKRLLMLHGKVGDAVPYVFGYHCDHTRQTTPMHAHKSVENSLDAFVDQVLQPGIPEQAETWGLAGIDLEETKLTDTINTAYRLALASAITKPLERPLEARYRSETYNIEVGTAEHVLPFLIDLFANAPRDTQLAWIGPQDQSFSLFTTCWESLSFVRPLVVWQPGADETLTEADAFIVNFGLPKAVEGEAIDFVQEGFFSAVTNERAHQESGKAPRRIIGVNAVHNRFESLMQRFVGFSRTPFSARLRHGYLLKSAFGAAEDWTAEMYVGVAGTKNGNVIQSLEGVGYVFYGPYAYLTPGDYEVEVVLALGWKHARRCKLRLDVAVAGRAIADATVVSRGRAATTVLQFHISAADASHPVEVRLHSSGRGQATLKHLILNAKSRK